MEIQVVHHGSAVASPDSPPVPLRALLPLDRLQRGRLRLVEARAVGGGQVRLTLSDGSYCTVPFPPARPLSPGVAPADAPATLAVVNAAQVLTMEGDGVGLRRQAMVLCDGPLVRAVLDAGDPAADRAVGPFTRVLDAGGGLVTPGLLDPHTHPVFVGQRAEEFGLKAAGASYLEIHKAGGGILATVNAVRQASFEQLCAATREHLDRLLGWGVTTCEGKSGYDLTAEGELRMLRALRAVAGRHPLEVEPTLLAAHALPPEYAQDRTGYVDLIVEQIIPAAAEQGLARFCDAYCEDGAFTPAEVERIFAAARRAGLGLRLHAEQFTHQGGTELAARLGALSADHLEAVSPEGIAALADGETVAVILPGAALTCRCPWPPARELLDAGAHLALGTDFNPGSSLCASLPLMMSLACMQMRVSCEEAWRAVTVEAARSLGRRELGRLRPGAPADLCLFDAPDYRYVPYHYGENHLRAVIKAGTLVHRVPGPA